MRKALFAVAVIALVVAGTLWLFVTRPQPPDTAAVPLEPLPAVTVAAAGPATAAAAAPATRGSASGAALPAEASPGRKHLQERLDALALAYEQGNWSAAERAMWPNHAVVRPNGEHLERGEIRDAWQEEWEGLSNRNLKFYVEKFDVKGGVAAAEWTVLLTADLTTQGGGVHHMMINGIQAATLVGEGAEQRLDGAIVYTAFERKLDGNDWPTD
jgi:hypothetical protein